MRGAEEGQARSFIASPRLEPDKSVLYDIDAADSVGSGEGVCEEEELGGVCGRLAGSGGLEFHRETLFEGYGDIFRGGAGLVYGVEGELPHVLWRGDVRVLEDARLVAAVGEVLVHGPGLGFRGGDGDVHLFGVVEEVVAADEAFVEFGHPPGGDDLDLGLESVEC